MKLANHFRMFAFVFIGGFLVACTSTPDEPQNEEQAGGSSTGSTLTTTGTGGGDNMVSKAGSGMEAKSPAEQAAVASSVFYFEFDRAMIRSSAYESLKAHAAYLAGNSSAKARLEGHADERGTREYNIALGERRGMAVSKFLMSNGVKASQLEVISYGEERASISGHDESSWSKNRRVELKYVAGRP